MECLLVEIVVDYRVTRTRHRVGLRSTTNLCVGGFNNSSASARFVSLEHGGKEGACRWQIRWAGDRCFERVGKCFFFFSFRNFEYFEVIGDRWKFTALSSTKRPMEASEQFLFRLLSTNEPTNWGNYYDVWKVRRILSSITYIFLEWKI